MTQPPITAEIHKSLNIHRNFPPKVTFDLGLAIDDLTDLGDFSLGQIIRPSIEINPSLSKNFLGRGATDTIYIGESHLDPLISR